jgi:hypothetical protein
MTSDDLLPADAVIFAVAHDSSQGRLVVCDSFAAERPWHRARREIGTRPESAARSC